MASKRQRRPTYHSWEQEPTHSWESDLPQTDGDASGDEFQYQAPDVWGEAAGRELVNYLLQLHLENSKMTAKAMCIICYWAHRAGAEGPCVDFGYTPDAKNTGYFKAQVDKNLGHDTAIENFHVVDTPMCSPYDGSRVIRKLPVNIFYEDLEDEIQSTPGFREQLVDWIAQHQDMLQYTQHEVVLANPDTPVHPVSFYVDGTPHVSRDSMIGFWAHSMVTNKRHLIATIRKSEKCGCGCGGWCTFWIIWNYIRWVFTAAANARRPTSKCNGAAFDPYDVGYDKRDSPLSYPVALILAKADEMEFGSTFAFPNWKSNTNPCRGCQASSDALFDVEGSTPDQLIFQETTPADMERATRLCEIEVMLDQTNHSIVEAALASDKNPGGARGRALTRDIPSLGLRCHDRLEPSMHVPDVFAFRTRRDFPITAIFWRRSNESIVRHRNPFFAIPGVTNKTCAWDILHLFYLGTVLFWTMRFLWACIAANIWGVPAGTQAHMDSASMARCSSDLHEFYAQCEKRPGGHTQFTQVKVIDIVKIGTRAEPRLTTKAGETKGLFFFCAYLLDKFSDRFPSSFTHLRHSCEAMKTIIEIIDNLNGRSPSAEERATLIFFGVRFLKACKSLWGEELTPKFHYMLHLLFDSHRNGDPNLSATWYDETLNKELATAGASAYHSVWHQRVLLTMREVLKQTHKRRLGAHRAFMQRESRTLPSDH